MGAVRDLDVEELENLIERVVRRALDDFRDDLEALASPEYLASIEAARDDYRAGRVTELPGD